jgi:hypothetical protein
MMKNTSEQKIINYNLNMYTGMLQKICKKKIKDLLVWTPTNQLHPAPEI